MMALDNCRLIRPGKKIRLGFLRSTSLLYKILPTNLGLTEHKRATRNGDVNHVAEHHLQTKHQIDWDSATCITYSTDYYQRLTLESWFKKLEQTPLNRS